MSAELKLWLGSLVALSLWCGVVAMWQATRPDSRCETCEVRR